VSSWHSYGTKLRHCQPVYTYEVQRLGESVAYILWYIICSLSVTHLLLTQTQADLDIPDQVDCVVYDLLISAA